MNGRASRAIDLARAVFARVREADVPFLAAGIAYFGFVSLPSLVLLAVVAASTLGGQQLVDAVVGTVSDVLTPSAQSVLEEALTTAGGRGTATVVGTVVLLWSGLRLFRGLDQAFGEVYQESRERPLTAQFRDAVLVLGVVGLAVLSMALAGAAVTALSGVQFVGLLSTAALLVGLFVVFLPLYVVFPGDAEDLRGAVPGTVLATVGWTVLESTFRIYAVRAASSPVYGVLGGALLLVTWLYFAAVVLLVGASLNATLSADRQVQSPGGPPLGTRAMAGDREDEARDRESDGGGSGAAPDLSALGVRFEEVAERVEALEERTVHRDAVEDDLRRYVRRRMRRGHARGWGPYLVLLYGTAMTLGAFFYLSRVWAILAMVVVWLSTLGLYVLLVLFGVAFDVLGLLGVPRRIADRIGRWRS